ncbi:MAG: DUF368 domain-containing protein [Chloroflexi bacterium]|nr:MAG: DUF368 domain-containing protein [Chloroflexota bacterium]
MATQQIDRPQTRREYLRLFFTGMAMGAADIVPGVSGGTMAFILGVYEALINGIKSFDVDVIRLLLKFKIREALEHIPLRFLIALGLGIATSVITLARGLDYLLDNEPIFLFAFFFGLVLASIIAISTRVEWHVKPFAALIIGAIVAYIIVGLVPVEASHDPLTLFFSGAVAIVAMILPGISGSFILLIVGQYEYVLEGVKDINIVTIVSVGAGAGVGIILFSRVLSWLLKHYANITIAALIGFMIGSLRKIWPWKETLETAIDRHGEEFAIRQANILPDFGSSEFLIALGLCIIAFMIVSIIDHLQTRNNPILRLFWRFDESVTAEGIAVAK